MINDADRGFLIELTNNHHKYHNYRRRCRRILVRQYVVKGQHLFASININDADRGFLIELTNNHHKYHNHWQCCKRILIRRYVISGQYLFASINNHHKYHNHRWRCGLILVRQYVVKGQYLFASMNINDADRGFLRSLESRMLCFRWPLLLQQQQQCCFLFYCSIRCCQCLSQCILIIARKRFLHARSIKIKKIKMNLFLLFFIYLYIYCSIKYVPSWSNIGHIYKVFH